MLSGEVDLVLDPSPQDLPRLRSTPNLKVIDGVENRTIFLGLDQHRDELPGSNIKGKNPLKDQRVRQALYQAIDINSIQRVAMRGLSQPTGTLVAPQVAGWSESVHKRLPHDVEAARKLPMPAIRRASRSISPAPTTATSMTRKSARRSRPCGRASASRPSCAPCRW
jgi:peptide/nickel transport system substrate-binding protein